MSSKTRVGKFFKKAVPMVVPAVLMGIGGVAAGGAMGAMGAGGAPFIPTASGAVAGQIGAPAAAAAAGGTTVGGATMAGTSQLMKAGSSIFSSSMSQGQPMALPAASTKGVPAAQATQATGTASEGIISKGLSWLEKNPETAKMGFGLIKGGVEGYQRGKELDEIKRQFDASRTWSGAFYGRTANDGLVSSRQRTPKQFL